MEIVKITEDKILVTLHSEEDTEELLAAVIAELIRRGFCSPSDSLFCEIFCSGGDTNIFVTLPPRGAKEDNVTFFTGGSSAPDPFGASRRHKIRERYIYEFDDFEALLSACVEISLSPVKAASLLESDGKVYLRLDGDSPIPGEFSGKRLSDAEAASAEERCREIEVGAAALGALAI